MRNLFLTAIACSSLLATAARAPAQADPGGTPKSRSFIGSVRTIGLAKTVRQELHHRRWASRFTTARQALHKDKLTFGEMKALLLADRTWKPGGNEAKAAKELLKVGFTAEQTKALLRSGMISGGEEFDVHWYPGNIYRDEKWQRERVQALVKTNKLTQEQWSALPLANKLNGDQGREVNAKKILLRKFGKANTIRLLDASVVRPPLGTTTIEERVAHELGLANYAASSTSGQLSP